MRRVVMKLSCFRRVDVKMLIGESPTHISTASSNVKRMNEL